MDNEKTSSVNQDLSLSDTRLSKISQIPHRFFLYATFQQLVESALLQTSLSKEDNPIQELLQDSLEDALTKVMTELNDSELFTVAEA